MTEGNTRFSLAVNCKEDELRLNCGVNRRPLPILEGKTKYRIDFRTDFPLRHSIINVDKMVPYVNRATGEAIFNRTPHPYPHLLEPDEAVAGGEENDESNRNERRAEPPPDEWGADPVHRAQVPQQTDTETHGFQKDLHVGSELVRIQGHRVRETVEDVHNGDGNQQTHRIKQAELLVLFKRARSQTVRRVWIPLRQLLIRKHYALVHEYLSSQTGLADSTPLFKHGMAIFAGKPFGAYVVAHDIDDNRAPYAMAFEDGDHGDFSEAVIQQLVQHGMVNMALPELQQLQVAPRVKKVHRVLVLCAGTKHDATGIKKIYPSAKIDTLDISSKYKPSIQADILKWEYQKYPMGYYDIIYASPQCTAFSKANPNPSAESVAHAVRMVTRCFEIIHYFQPYVWILENPVNRLQHMPFMQRYEHYRQTTSYCMFQALFRKDTNVWSNIAVMLPRCSTDTRCDFKQRFGFHQHTAQAGPSELSDGTVIPGTPAWRAQQMPFALLQYLFQHVPMLC